MLNSQVANPFNFMNQGKNRVPLDALICPMAQSFVLGLHVRMNVKSFEREAKC
jgi:hypothetical protein